MAGVSSPGARPSATHAQGQIVHASCVAWNQRGLLITGTSGSGKSTLALSLMGHGARLVADDRVNLRLEAGSVVARAAPNLAGLIEARGIGLLWAEPLQSTRLIAVVDLDRVETERLPPNREIHLLGRRLGLLYRVEGPHFAPALMQFLKAGRRDPDHTG